MLNHPPTSIASMKEIETDDYASVSLTNISVLRQDSGRYFIYVLTDGQAMFAKKIPKTNFGQTWAAFNNAQMTGKPIYTAYTLRNLKGKIATYES